MTPHRNSAPKADALPGCATPRTAETPSFGTTIAQAHMATRGNERQNKAGIRRTSPGIVPNREPDETWRPIPSVGGLYEASDQGRIRRATTRRVLVSRERLRDGYISIDLSVDGHRLTRTVNTLVCEAYHGPRPEGYHCAHLNGVRRDNRANNLAWATPAENADHRWAHGTMIFGGSVSHHKLTDAKVVAIREGRSKGATYRELAEIYGVSIQTIARIIKGKRWKHVAFAGSVSMAGSAA